MNAIFERFQLMLNETMVSASEKVWTLLPEILFAIVVVFVGWVAAVLVHHIVLRVLSFFAIDKLAAKTPLNAMLKTIGIHKSISEIFGLLVFWMLILLTLVIAADILHLKQVSMGLSKITGYIPQILASILIVIFGMLLAKFLQMIATQSLSKMDISYKKYVGKAVQYVVLVFVFVAAIDQLGFNLAYILNGIVTIVSVMLLLIGLGCVFGARTVIDNATACQQIKRQLPVGSQIVLDTHAGTVQGFTLTNVILTQDNNEELFIPATDFLIYKYTHVTHDN